MSLHLPSQLFYGSNSSHLNSGIQLQNIVHCRFWVEVYIMSR